MTTIPQVLSDGVAEALAHVRTALEFAYKAGLHEFGYDPAAVLERAMLAAAPSPVAPVLPAVDALPSERSAAFLDWWHEHGRKLCITPECAEYVFEAGRAALSKQVPAGDASEFKMPDAGHPLLQRLIDSISIESGKACWDYLAMYEVRDELARLSQSGQADSTGGKA